MPLTKNNEPFLPPPSPLGCVDLAYHQLSDMQYELALGYLQRLKLLGNETLIDAGCGSGRVTQKILERLPHGHVIGLDLSERALCVARQEIKASPGQRLSFYRADLQTWCEPLAADAIFSNMALHCVSDHAKLFSNFAKVLRPGGWLALQFACTEHTLRLTTQLRHFMGHQAHSALHWEDAFEFSGSDVQSAEAQLHAAGFIDIQVESLPTPHSPDQNVKMAEFFSSTLAPACLASVSDDSLQLQFDAQRDQTLDQACSSPFNFIRASARLP